MSETISAVAETLEQIRAFISIKVAPEIIQALQQWQRRLDQALPKDSLRWTSPEQMHLTLKFLGNIEVKGVADLEAALKPIAQACAPFQLRAEGLGSFPGIRNPRVIWVGLQGDLQTLQQLQTEVERVTSPWAAKEENRKFHPHLTLGRVRETALRKGREIGQVIQATTVPRVGQWQVTQFHLMRSQLSPKGAVHSELAAFPFAGME